MDCTNGRQAGGGHEGSPPCRDLRATDACGNRCPTALSAVAACGRQPPFRLAGHGVGATGLNYRSNQFRLLDLANSRGLQTLTAVSKEGVRDTSSQPVVVVRPATRAVKLHDLLQPRCTVAARPAALDAQIHRRSGHVVCVPLRLAAFPVIQPRPRDSLEGRADGHATRELAVLLRLHGVDATVQDEARRVSVQANGT